MSNSEIIPMDDLTNGSIHQRCASLVNHIKTQKENRLDFPLSTTRNNNVLLLTKRYSFKETDSAKAARFQTYSNWPHFTPSREAMSSNGWFYCNITDRVICIYCNTICHQWINTDDPYDVHIRLAPECPFILSLPTSSSKDSPSTVNHTLNDNFQPRHTSMCEISRRQETFNSTTWTQTSPSVDDLTLAGFFYSGTGNTVTCFHCGGCLQKWGVNDNPQVEHARWFPNCIYAKHLCGDRLHAKIQLRKKQVSKENKTIDTETLFRLVNARLDLPVVQRLRTQYKLAIIKRCIEDQLKNNHDDFASDNDLAMACFLLQKQLDIIEGKPDKIVIPSQSQVSISSPEITNTKLEECIVCFTTERQLACMPCGHLCTCVPCGYAVRCCPICRQQIQSFVRIYS